MRAEHHLNVVGQGVPARRLVLAVVDVLTVDAGVHAQLAVQVIEAEPTIQPVVACLPVDLVVTTLAEEAVSTGVTVDLVRT